jgi:hypothetical protein
VQGGALVLDYPKPDDVVVRYNSKHYFASYIKVYRDASGTHCLSVVTQNADNEVLFFTSRLFYNASNPTNSLNDVLTLVDSTAGSTVQLNLNGLITGTTAKKYGQYIVCDNSFNINVNLDTKITGNSGMTGTVGLTPTSKVINMKIGTPTVSMDCSELGMDMAKTKTKKGPLTDSDVIQMITSSLVIFIGLFGVYASQFGFIYGNAVIKVAQKYNKDAADTKSHVGMFNMYWNIVLLTFAILSMAYGMGHNSKEYTTAGIFLILVIAFTGFLLNSLDKTKYEFDYNYGGIDWSNKYLMGGLGFGLIGWIACFFPMVLTIAKVIKDEKGFIVSSIMLIVSAVLGYAGVIIGAKL